MSQSGPSFKVYPMVTEARYWPNNNYGSERLMKSYAGYPMKEPVWAVIPHGIFYEDDYIFPGEAKAPVPCVLNYPEHRDAIWSTYKEVVPAAAPFLYALEVFEHQKERRGTIVMPQHTTTLYDMEYDWWTFWDERTTLPKPVTALLYWQDLQRGSAKYFPCVVKTCGHVQDPLFMQKLVWHLTGAEYVVSNEVGSYTQYATAAGAKFRLVGERPLFRLNERGIKEGYRDVFHDSENRHPEEQRRVAEIDALFRDRDFAEPITQEQRECCDYYLRRSAFKSPEGLLADFEHCKARHIETPLKGGPSKEGALL